MEKQDWSFVISAKTSLLDIHPRELWEYRNLIWMFVKRNFATMYKQTILGPIWILLNPLMSTTVFTIIFGKFANLPTEGVPDFLFYMAANILWVFFSATLQKTAFTFSANAGLFGKVYFPRLSVPIANIVTNLCTFLVQFGLFAVLLLALVLKGSDVRPNAAALLAPVLLLEISLLCLGVGLLISSVTVKYHDLSVLVSFGLQLWMYASPVVYPAAMIPETWRGLFLLNPMAPVIETFRFGFLGTGAIPWSALGISWVTVSLLLVVGILAFHRAERTFLDVI